MRIIPISTNQKNQNFQAINKKYFEWAKRDVDITTSVSCHWHKMFSFEIFLYKQISKQDGLDTANAVQDYIKQKFNKESFAVNDLLASIKKLP